MTRSGDLPTARRPAMTHKQSRTSNSRNETRSDPPSPHRPRRSGGRPYIVREAERREYLFQLYNLGIGGTGAVPQIVVHRTSLPPSRSRNSFIPRNKLTRTESGFNPVLS